MSAPRLFATTAFGLLIALSLEIQLVAAAPPDPAVRDVFQHSGLSGEEAARAMTVPDGFAVTLFAGEPDVQQPIAMCFDDRGRLWVAEAYNYPFRAAEGQAKDRILIFEDGDGDGRFDTRRVFVDKLNLVSGLEVGFGGVWVGAAPHLLFFADADGDDRPDGPPRVLLDGWGYQDTHETLNAFIWGPDGWLYGCHGVFTHSHVGKPGAADKDRVPINAGIWRYHPTRHQFEVFAHGTSNPWGVDFNDHGQAFLTACVIPHLFHVIQGARYHRQAGQHFNPYTYDDIKTIAVHRHWVGEAPHAGNNRSDSAGGGHAHSGAMIYLGGRWPAKYRNQVFMSNIHGARINMDLLSERGSGYVGNRAPDFLLANDSWSQILNLRYGPDGQVMMIDWYDANQCHRADAGVHDRSNGRIFKVTYGDAEPVKVDLARLSDAQLVELQLHENDWYVRHARRILQQRGGSPAVHAALAEMAMEHPDETRRLRGLWALHVTGGLTEPRIAQGLKNDNSWVRAWTIQLAMEDCQPSAATLERFAEMARNDSEQIVRLYLGSAVIRLPIPQRPPILAALVAHGEDSSDPNLGLLYWYAAEPLAAVDARAALDLAALSKVPLVRAYMARRIAQLPDPAPMDLLVDKLLVPAENIDEQRTLLRQINQGLAGRRKVAMPGNWPQLYDRLLSTGDFEIQSQATALALSFGDQRAIDELRKFVADRSRESSLRQAALDALVKARAGNLTPFLYELLGDTTLRSAALQALAAYDDAGTPQVILKAYEEFNPQQKRDALATLASRVAYGQAMLAAVGEGRLPATDLSADLIRQLRNHRNPALDKRIVEVWGTVQETPAERKELLARYKQMLTARPEVMPDLFLGRAMFAKTCQQCHTLYGVGAKIGPELTGSNRSDLDYLLTNIIDPSELIGKDYQATVIATDDGRLLTGIIQNENDISITLATANETVVVPKSEIDQRQPSTKSMMPDDILKPLTEHEVRSLVAYLRHIAQVPMLATPDNVLGLFNGQDLTGWRGNRQLWSVEQPAGGESQAGGGEIVGRTTGLTRNEFLISDLLTGDFRLSLEVKLVDNRGNSGVQFRSTPLPSGAMEGYQADIGAGWWGKLYEEHGRGLLWKDSDEGRIRPGQWNRYEIVAVGPRIRTWINGQLCVDLDDPTGARKGLFALQLHAGGPMEVRFRNFALELNPKIELAERRN